MAIARMIFFMVKVVFVMLANPNIMIIIYMDKINSTNSAFLSTNRALHRLCSRTDRIPFSGGAPHVGLAPHFAAAGRLLRLLAWQSGVCVRSLRADVLFSAPHDILPHDIEKPLHPRMQGLSSHLFACGPCGPLRGIGITSGSELRGLRPDVRWARGRASS